MGFDPVSLTIAGVSMTAQAAMNKSSADAARAANQSASQTMAGTYDQALQNEQDTLATQNQQLDQNLKQATEQYGQAVQALNPYAEAGKTALSAYQQALTPGGSFKIEDTPFYDYEKTQLDKNLSSTLAAQGKGRATTAAATVYAPAYQSLGESATNRYMSDQNNLINLGYGAAGTQAGILQSTGNLYTNYGANKANLAGVGGQVSQGYMLNKGQVLANKDITNANIQQQEMKGYGQIMQSAPLTYSNIQDQNKKG